MFNTFIRDNVLRYSVESWCDFIKKFTVPIEDDSSIYLINSYPIMVLNLEVNLNFKRKKEKVSKHTKVRKEDEEDDKEKDHEEPIKYEPSYQ
jgi:hypothetical protein